MTALRVWIHRFLCAKGEKSDMRYMQAQQAETPFPRLAAVVPPLQTDGRIVGQVHRLPQMNQERERAHYHLLIWGEWRRTDKGSVGLGYPPRSALLSTGGCQDEFDHLVEVEDNKSAEISESIIDDLPALYRTALESEYLLQGVFKPGRLNSEELLTDAIANYWAKARRHLV